MTDTIAAIATAAGRGAVGIVRLSGPRAFAIAGQIAGELPAPRQAGLRPLRDAQGEVLDQGLVLCFPGPHSFTGEDVVELQGHGGPVVLTELLQNAVDHGFPEDSAGGDVVVRLDNDGSQLRQGLKRAPCLRTKLGLQCAQVTTHAELAAMLIDHLKVHEKVGAQHVQLEVVALHIQTGLVPHFFQQHIGQATRTKQLGG